MATRNAGMKILYIEDSESDILIMKRTIRHLENPVELFVSQDGEDAINRLERHEPYQEHPYPNLIILDLSIPKVYGFDVLRHIKTHQKLCVIPVIVLTTSREHSDCEKSYREHANAYIVKPLRMHEFRHTMKVLIDFWITIAKTQYVR